MRFLFGSCALDLGTRQLLVEGLERPISPKAFQLLETLLRRRPEAVSRDELQKALWPGTHVSETNLPALVAEVRQAIGDSARSPKFIRTVHRFGYAFAAEARETAQRKTERAVCRLKVQGERDFLLGAGEFIVGRDEEASVPINSLSISRRHARLSVRPEGATVEDLASKNGSFVNGQRITRPTPLSSGDAIVFGDVAATFELLSSRLSTETGVVLTDVIAHARRARPGGPDATRPFRARKR